MKKKLLVRISPDGKEVVHLYSDRFSMGDHADIAINRASDVHFCNDTGRWAVRILFTGETLPQTFAKRSNALKYEQKYLEARMRSRDL